MNDTQQTESHETLNDEVRSIWEENANFWDGAMGDGNAFQRLLIAPSAERLLQAQPGQLILDIACGNGVFARRLAEMGAQVVACDFSPTFIERARERTTEYTSRIEFQVIDATQHAEVMALAEGPTGRRSFDAAYCGMAIQDMVEIEPLFSALFDLIKPGGWFVFSIPHPAFNNSYIRKVIEQQDQDGELVVQYAIKITGYSEPRIDKGLGIAGQPVAQYYFHRSISQIYQTAFRYGFVLDGIEEPTFAEPTGQRPFSWENFQGIPPVLLSRMKRL